jgi:hypothetical protein
MDSERLNIVGLETAWGFKTIELYEADLSLTNFDSDVLVFSVFAGGYNARPGTLLGDLKSNLRFNISDEEKMPAYDFRKPLSLWISRALQGYPFRRVIAIEMKGSYWPIKECIDNVFAAVAALSAKGVEVRTIATPVLGAGNQKIAPAEIIPSLLNAAEGALRRHECPRRILFVEKNSTRAQLLSQQMDLTLRRASITLPKTELLKSLRADLKKGLDNAADLVSMGHAALFDEARRLVDSETTRSVEIGLIGRRLVEFVVDDILSYKKPSIDLVKKIDALDERKIAPWIRGYMHTLRILGNESVHEKTSDGRIPAHVNQDDLALCLFCLQRVVEFWKAYRH